MPEGTDSVLLPESLVTVGSVGGFMSTVSFSWPGAPSDCLYTADHHVSWNLSAAPVGAVPLPKLQYVRWVYNASAFTSALSGCLGSSALENQLTLTAQGRASGRDAELEAVKEYVVALQYNCTAQALICDLLEPTARYCDPYPVSCAIGRRVCRAMKGLPPDDGRVPSDGARATVTAPQEQCRPGSVRPMMPAGPATVATYIAYSSAERLHSGRVYHKLHHTWAIWELAPINSTHAAPAPMLASFDWFMPERNV
mmetsp:Transcript_22263/g.58149  ORF Transcript_22263/g.58149 Transcript_22263/m.58149 type:complete len:254 (-) Transcript_22263:139-900(-)